MKRRANGQPQITEKKMSETKTIQEVVMASIQAEDNGVIVDWKQTCMQVVNAAQALFNQIDEAKKAEEDGDE